jgi:hypothetical protein
MGVRKNITLSKFPDQGDWLGKRCSVCFHYDTQNQIGGTVVRCDREEPGLCIIRLDDGRVVLATECMHTMPK